MTNLSLWPLFERLRDANREFDALFMQRNQSKASADRVDVRAVRIECDKAVSGFWTAIDYCVVEYGNAAYMGLINEVNSLNQYYKQQLKTRATLRKAKKDVSKDEPIKIES